MSPRRKTERDVPETDGTDGRHRRMSLRWKAKTDGPSVFMSLHLRDISFEWCVWVQRCVSLADASSGVCIWLCVYRCVCRSGWLKEHVFWWDIFWIIKL